MKVFVDKKECILTWIIILSFSIGIAGLLGPGLSKTERIIGMVSILIFAGVSIMREELYDSKKIGDDKSDDEIVFDNGKFYGKHSAERRKEK